MWRGDEIAFAFETVHEVLRAHEPLWRPSPWRALTVPWERDHPALATALRALPREAVVALEQDPTACALPEPWPAWREAVHAVGVAGALPQQPHPAARWPMRARKQAQVDGFLATAAPVLHGAAAVVEGCSGVGHLGRALGAHHRVPVRLLERDPALCRTPAGAYDTDVTHTRCDLGADAAPWLRRDDGVVALHACGTLTDRLLDGARRARAHAVVAAPCCYHRLIGTTRYEPTSARAQRDDLGLDVDILRVATRETTHAGARRTRLRAVELQSRVAWDLWRRRVDDRHHPLPAMSRTAFHVDLGSFLDARADALGVPRFDGDLEALRTEADQRVTTLRALDLPRVIARRAFELWIVLDRALTLVEAGWDVAVGTFCPAACTPRNLAITARRSAG
jgi:hypothetical protein